MTKKLTAVTVLAALVLTLAAACSNTSYIATVGDEKYPVGTYAFYAYYTRDNYMANLQAYGVTDFANALTQDADANGTKLYSYIIEETKNSYISHILVEKKFEEYGLSLTAEQQELIDEGFQTTWIDGYGLEKFTEICKTLGITSAEFKDIISISYKNQQLQDYLFGAGGIYEITDSELINNYNTNYERFRCINVSKLDSEGSMLSTDALIEKKALVDEAYNKALAGEDFAEIIKQYSESYIPVSDDLSDEYKELYEQSNKEQMEDGYVTDKNGIFDYMYYYYYSYYLDSAIVDKVFSMNVGDIDIVELANSFWIIEKCDKNEKEDYFNSKKDLIYSSISTPILNDLYTEWEADLLLTFNTAAVNKYDPRRIDALFVS